jgi:hypothetical protein
MVQRRDKCFKRTISLKNDVLQYRSLNAIFAQAKKNCQYIVDTTTELKNIATTSENNANWRNMFGLRILPISTDVVIILSSTVVLTPNGNFPVVPVL